MTVVKIDRVDTKEVKQDSLLRTLFAFTSRQYINDNVGEVRSSNPYFNFTKLSDEVIDRTI